MTTAQFFEKFDLIADAPDAVAKIRELVLHLAVTGKLVRQDPREESAALLMVAVEQSREALVSEGKIRRIASQPPLTASDIPFECPSSWVWARFGDVSWSYRGHNPPKSVFRDTPAPGYVRFIQQRDFRSDDHAVYVPDSRHLKIVRKGEIVMAAYGNIGNTCRTVEGAFNVAIAKIMEIPPVERDYIDLLIRSEFIRGALEKVSSRVAVPSMSSDHMRSLPVPLPPLAEQKRIVAKVDELMALCDQLEAQQQDREIKHSALAQATLARFAEAPTPTNLNLLFHSSFSIQPSDLRKTILTLAVQGKLVPQDPDDETTTATLSRLGLQSSVDSIPGDTSLPSSWSLVRFEDVAQTTGGVTLGRKLANRKTITLPYLRVANVKRGAFDLSIIKEISIAEDELERYSLRKGDLLMTEGGDWDKVGRAALWQGQIPNCLHQNHIFRSRMRSAEISPVWFELYFNSPDGRRYFESAAKQTTNLASINMRQVRNCTIPLPPLAEQKRIVAKVEELMALVDALEAQQAAADQAATHLLDAVVSELAAAA